MKILIPILGFDRVGSYAVLTKFANLRTYHFNDVVTKEVS